MSEWREWSGIRRPVAADQMVWIKFRTGAVHYAKADAVGWNGCGAGGDVVAWSIEKPDDQFDPINAPDHYTSHASGIQPIDIAEHLPFCLGNVIKYVMRFEKKGGLEDLRKAEFYIKREIARREKQA